MNEPLVALVDDYPEVLALMAEVLLDAGYRTVTGTSADEAEDLLARDHHDLLILDIRLPGAISGLPLLQAIRENPATARLPILVATADLAFLRENAGTLEDLGCETLPKPFDIDALLGCVGSLVPAFDRSEIARSLLQSSNRTIRALQNALMPLYMLVSMCYELNQITWRYASPIFLSDFNHVASAVMVGTGDRGR